MGSATSSTPRSDQTARARIRDAALGLLADHGARATTIRAVADAADVSPALVLHHFGSKQGLVEHVDDHVADVLTTMLDDWVDQMARDPEGALTTSAVEGFLAGVVGQDPLLAYVCRAIVQDTGPGRRLVERLLTATESAMVRAVDQGVLRPSGDPAMRASLLVAHDLGVLLLRDHLERHLAVDVLGPSGLHRWAAEATDIYSNGLLAEAT